MKDKDIQIFDDNDEVVLPGSEHGDGSDTPIDVEESNLISHGVVDAISGEVVKSVLIPEDTGIIQPNYVIDLTDIKDVEPLQIVALDSLVHEDGDVALYLYITGGIQKIGMGYSWMLDKILVTAMNNVFGEECRVYRDFTPGEPVEVIDGKNITNLKLTI